MKTTILEDLNLPDEVQAALSRESLRRGVPVNVLLSEFIVAKSKALVAASTPPPLNGPHGPGVHQRVAA